MKYLRYSCRNLFKHPMRSVFPGSIRLIFLMHYSPWTADEVSVLPPLLVRRLEGLFVIPLSVRGTDISHWQ